MEGSGVGAAVRLRGGVHDASRRRAALFVDALLNGLQEDAIRCPHSQVAAQHRNLIGEGMRTLWRVMNRVH